MDKKFYDSEIQSLYESLVESLKVDSSPENLAFIMIKAIRNYLILALSKSKKQSSD